MAKGKALQPLKGSYGRVNAGETFELRESDLKKLVDAGVAEMVSGDKKAETTEEEAPKEKAVKVEATEKKKDAGPNKAK